MSFELPPAFADRMRAQLGEEAEAYFAALEMPYLRGLRLNPEKRLCAKFDELRLKKKKRFC